MIEGKSIIPSINYLAFFYDSIGWSLSSCHGQFLFFYIRIKDRVGYNATSALILRIMPIFLPIRNLITPQVKSDGLVTIMNVVQKDIKVPIISTQLNSLK